MNLYRVYHQILSKDENEALSLVQAQRASYAEVARHMGKTTDAIKLLVFAARQKLFTGMGRTLTDLDEQFIA